SHQFKNDRPIFDLRPQPRDTGSQDATMIEDHRPAWNECRLLAHADADRFFDEACFIDQFVALQDQFLIPWRAIKAERDRQTLCALTPLRRIARGLRPGAQSGDHGLFNECRWRCTPVFPRKIVVPVAPPRITRAFRMLFARQAKIADGNETPCRPLSSPVAIGESVKLFDIAERMTGLLLDPLPQPGLQGAAIEFEWARWQCGAIADGHNPRLAIGNGRQHRNEIDCQARRDERRRSLLQSHRLISFANSRRPLLISSGTTVKPWRRLAVARA